MTAEDHIAGRLMRRLPVRHAANDDVLVGVTRRARQMLGNANAGHVGLDGLEQAAIPRVDIRLRIERVELAHAAREP
jgi:hypothetical protein